jgi:glutamate-1-semialdehyde 2,1-aminomutase
VAMQADTERLLARAQEIARDEMGRLLERSPGSAALHARAIRSLPNGVSSNFQTADPYPIYLSHAKGPHVWDVDGLDYLDFHGGFGVNVVGHAHPKIVEAV